jgi:hypothetical protein
MVRPSYKSGFARGPDESANPGLWDGLVGLWMPTLGPTGLTLRDVSGRENHGTLTNMDPATDWVASPYGWALDFVRASDQDVRVAHDASLVGMGQLTLAAWVWSRSTFTSGDEYSIFDKWDSGQIAYLVRGDTTNEFEFFTDTTSGTVGGGHSDLVIDDQTWHLIVCTYDGTTMRAYSDGVASATTRAQTGTISATTSSLSLGGQLAAASDFWWGQLALAAIWSRALFAREIVMMSADPHAIVRRRRRVVVSVPAAAAAGDLLNLPPNLMGNIGHRLAGGMQVA